MLSLPWALVCWQWMELQREEEISVEINLPLGEVWLFRLEREGFFSM